MKRIYLIDCPGVVPPNNNDTEEDILLRGVVRVENVENPEQYISAVLKKAQARHIEKTYDIRPFADTEDFLNLLARKGGRLLKGGEADMDGVAKMVLNDFLRGKIPWFTPPPKLEGKEEEGIEGREGRLGEMGKKRKRDAEEEEGVVEPQNVDISAIKAAVLEGTGVADEVVGGEEDEEDEDEDEKEEEFEGFDDEDEDEEDRGVPSLVLADEQGDAASNDEGKAKGPD